MSYEQDPAFLKNQISIELYNHQDDYHPGTLAQDGVTNKVFVGVVAGIAAGKSTFTNEVHRQYPQIGLIDSRTTRGPKPDDPEGYKTAADGITHSVALDAVNSGEVVNYSAIRGGNVYFTLPEDFPGKYSTSPFLPSSIDHVRRAGFERDHFVYIVAAGELWKRFVTKMLAEAPQEMPIEHLETRIVELLDSTQFALDNPELFTFIENSEDPRVFQYGVDTIAKLALEGTAVSLDFDSAKSRIEEMRTAAKEILGE